VFEQAFNAIDDTLRTEAGCATELDYIEQTSWLLFLKYLDGLEQDRSAEAALLGKRHKPFLDKDYRWQSWATPHTKDGAIDHNKAMTGDDLVEFVNGRLFPYLRGFKEKADGPNTIEYKVGEVFGELKNKFTSGYTLRDVIDRVDELRFRSQTEKHELSQLYEEKIKRMGNAGRNGGEYYTPRPLIRAIIKVVAPKVGETIYDPACGSAGFLCEAFDYLRAKPGTTTAVHRVARAAVAALYYSRAILDIAEIVQSVRSPIVTHSNPRIVSNTSALAASSAAISSRISAGVRCFSASPPLGFFTDRSHVSSSRSSTSTVQDLDPSSFFFWSLTNSARSSSLRGLVLPRLRPGSSW
jgi:type I restriction enzyme M protein